MRLHRIFNGDSKINLYDGRQWANSTATERRVQDTLRRVAEEFAAHSGVRLCFDSRSLAALQKAPEVADCLIRLDELKDEEKGWTNRTGLPPKLYGIPIQQVLDDSIPPGSVEIVTDDERYFGYIQNVG